MIFKNLISLCKNKDLRDNNYLLYLLILVFIPPPLFVLFTFILSYFDRLLFILVKVYCDFLFFVLSLLCFVCSLIFIIRTNTLKKITLGGIVLLLLIIPLLLSTSVLALTCLGGTIGPDYVKEIKSPNKINRIVVYTSSYAAFGGYDSIVGLYQPWSLPQTLYVDHDCRIPDVEWLDNRRILINNHLETTIVNQPILVDGCNEPLN